MTTLPHLHERLSQFPRPPRDLTVGAAAVGTSTMGLAVLGSEVLEREPIAHEQAAMLWLHVHTTPALHTFAEVMNVVGGPHVTFPALVLLPIVLWGMRHRSAALFTTLAFWGAMAAQWGLKLVFGRPRPDLWPTDVQVSGLSFPSGHATAAAALALVVGFLAWRTPYRWAAVVVGALYAALMMLSRVVLGVHYPSDVLAGALTATLSVVTVFLLMRRQVGVK